MSAVEIVGDRLIAIRDVAAGSGVCPVYVEGTGDYTLPCSGADKPGSRLPDANVRCLNWQETAITGEAVVRLDHPGYIVTAWSEGDDAMHQLRAAVRSLVESELAMAS